MTSPNPPAIRLAIPSKGHLADGAIELLKTAGYSIRRASERQYEATVSGHPRFHVVFMRPTDIVLQVEEGRCQLGVTGMDLFAERESEAVNSQIIEADLGYGGCRLTVAVPESWIDVTHMLDLFELAAEFQAQGRSFRVSTKYPILTRAYFHHWGIYYFQLIHSDGALELHPTLGISDIIVDLTSSGTTLRDNRLREIKGGTVLDSAACLIGHAPSLTALVAEGETGDLALMLDAVDGVRASSGMLHLEVVGGPSSREDGVAAQVASYLDEHGAQHVARGEVWDAGGRAGWRVTALVAARKLTSYQRALFQLGAARVVGLPARFVFERESPTTYDRLKQRLSHRTR